LFHFGSIQAFNVSKNVIFLSKTAKNQSKLGVFWVILGQIQAFLSPKVVLNRFKKWLFGAFQGDFKPKSVPTVPMCFTCFVVQ